MRVAVSSDGNALSGTKIISTPADFNQGVAALINTAKELSEGTKIEGVSGGIAGPLDKENIMLVHSPHMKGWIQKPLKQELEKLFGCSVILRNDTVVGGIGEAVKGAGAGKRVVAYLAIGTGVGGKRIVDGKIDESSLNFEPGHQIIVPDGYPCHCGGKGHLEAYVGGAYIEEVYKQKGEDIKDPVIWGEIAKYLSIGLTNTIVHWNPDIVVLGGSVAKSLPFDKVEAYLNEDLTIYPEPPQLAIATLGHDAGLYGALELLK